MTSMKSATAAALAGLFVTGLASADVYVSVEHDATYSLSESCGVPCSGGGAEPAGNACPKAGDVATADCHSHLLSYNGADCVAPADAQCILIHDNVWGCAFPKMGYNSAGEAESVAAYDGEHTDWSTTYEMDNQASASVPYDTTLDTPLEVNCDVVSETSHQTDGGMESGEYHGLTDTAMVDHQKSAESEYETSNHYSALRTGTTESDMTESDHDSHDGPMNAHYVTDKTDGDMITVNYGTTESTAQGEMMAGGYATDTTMKGTHDIIEGGESMASYPTGTTLEGKTDMTGGYATETLAGDSHESYTSSMTPEDMTGGYTSDTNYGATPVAPSNDHMTYESESHVVGHNEYQQAYEYVTPDTTMPESAESYHGSEHATKQTTYTPTYQSPYGTHEETAYASTEKPCDLGVPEGGNVLPPTDEGLVEPVITLPSLTLAPVTLPTITLPTLTLAPVTLPTITLPTLTLAPVTLPTLTLAPVTLPTITLPETTLPSLPLLPITEPLITLSPIEDLPTTVSPCSDGSINGVQVETQVRYNNLDIISTTAGIGNEQSWRSCCEQCLLNLVCVTFSFEQLVSANVCVLTGSATGQTTDLPNWQSGNVLSVRASAAV